MEADLLFFDATTKECEFFCYKKGWAMNNNDGSAISQTLLSVNNPLVNNSAT